MIVLGTAFLVNLSVHFWVVVSEAVKSCRLNRERSFGIEATKYANRQLYADWEEQFAADPTNVRRGVARRRA